LDGGVFEKVEEKGLLEALMLVKLLVLLGTLLMLGMLLWMLLGTLLWNGAHRGARMEKCSSWSQDGKDADAAVDADYKDSRTP
jgi:hypothetical protein